jgi:hypothetical protein
MRTGICCSKFYITRRILEEWISVMTWLSERRKKRIKTKIRIKLAAI